ncbi:hypothetical protein EIG99_08665 [Staphylococcus condimenti]|uniref:Phage holin n=1 Tax=Staphylococcus condimenti TaxID=70255 RepID=A0A4Q7CL82_9STAP|nr:phage holin [Staphylococcus condimenti]RZI01516.1 hypothetical protein EIG99_08665 [Staphylococcus condimenti]
MEQKKPKLFLGINWTVRFKHPQFWIGIILSILVPPLAYTGTEFNEVTSWDKFFAILGDGFKNPYIVLMMIVGIYNTIIDKTTKSFGDSYIAKQYLRPRTDYDPKQALDWEVNTKRQKERKDIEENKQSDEPNNDVEVVDGIKGKEISNGDMKDEIELNNQTAEDTFGDIDNEVFGDSAEPQEIGNDTDEEYREKKADADIRGTDIRG